ncbi:MAG: glycosyltransferase family 2 protein [Candidatus Gracilibacteria bacterium]|jgi:hypothetical protein
MKLSILIVNYNQKYFPKLCLEALNKSKTDFDYEVIFCDNNSSDESIEFLKKAASHGKIQLVRAKKNVGFGSANNLAAKKAKGKFVLILNADVMVEEDTLQKMIDYMEKHKDVGILAPKLVYHDGTIQPSCRRDFRFLDLFIKRTFLKKIPPFKKRYQRYVMADYTKNKEQEVDLVTGAFMMMPRALFERVGGFDERYFLFMEDFDLCKKVRKTGKKIVYYPHAKATHYHKRLSEGSAFMLAFKKISWLHLNSAFKYFWKWK